MHHFANNIVNNCNGTDSESDLLELAPYRAANGGGGGSGSGAFSPEPGVWFQGSPGPAPGPGLVPGLGLNIAPPPTQPLLATHPLSTHPLSTNPLSANTAQIAPPQKFLHSPNQAFQHQPPGFFVPAPHQQFHPQQAHFASAPQLMPPNLQPHPNFFMPHPMMYFRGRPPPIAGIGGLEGRIHLMNERLLRRPEVVSGLIFLPIFTLISIYL